MQISRPSLGPESIPEMRRSPVWINRWDPAPNSNRLCWDCWRWSPVLTHDLPL